MSDAVLTARRASPFTEEAVHRLSARWGEPSWAAQARLDALHTYLQTPFPPPHHEWWRRTDVTSLPYESFSPDGGAPSRPRLGFARALLRRPQEYGALLVQADGLTLRHLLAPEAEQAGVVALPLQDALRQRPDLVQAWLGKAIAPSENRFTALASAFCNGGAVVYLPRHAQVERPIHLVHILRRPHSALFPRTLIVAEEGASATIVEDYIQDGQEPVLAIPLVELLLDSSAQVRYTGVQSLGPEAVYLAFQRSRLVGRDASLLTYQIHFGSRFVKTVLENHLQGQGSRSDLLGILFGDQAQVFDQVTLQDHHSPHTTSDLLYKAALKDTARAIYYGTVKVRKGAIKTDAFQTNKNLLLGGHPKADSVPVLEIEADDLRCSHAASVGPVDEEHLFYLRSRGIPLAEAHRILVEGFFDPLAQRVPTPWLRQRIWALIHQKLASPSASNGR
ncbi:MAG: Fe-S cluster assembly protein SufD [Dehalococcoidia bacterium]|nr:Fe-S cluster assembly protein SufD [Dehalococcoidia bacterium]MDW8120209.1 Fe-S cluster assembly protein SufD [Chloroflexota bacterium]